VLNIGMMEVVVLLLLAFIVVGPKDLPKVAVFIAKSIKYVRRLVNDLMSSIDLDDELKDIKGAVQVIDDVKNKNPKALAASAIKKELADVTQAVDSVKEELNVKVDLSLKGEAKEEADQVKEESDKKEDSSGS